MPAPELTFSHLGFFVHDLERMAEFYSRLLGFTISDRGELDTPRGKVSLVFLTRDPREHHQIVLASGRPHEVSFNAINQISFRMGEFAGLRAMYRALQDEKGVSEIAPVSHGNALSVYFRDPEGNRIELFVDTPWYVDQPMRIPMDMSLEDDALWQWAEQTAREHPGYKPAEPWRAEIAKRNRAS
jgi:catechol-2,3-dioxygenase